MQPTAPSRLLLVHVWTERGRFRARVRAVDAETEAMFASVQTLARYLAQQAATHSAGAEPAARKTCPGSTPP